MTPRLTTEQRQAIDENDGCIEVEDASGKCILMSMEVFRNMMGIGTEHDFQESVAALRSSFEQYRRGQTRPCRTPWTTSDADMAFRVEITPQAEADLDEGYRYIAGDSPGNALRWWLLLYDLIERLSLFPEGCSLAPENEAVPFEVRQKLCGNYRILFTIDGNRVVVLRLRHAARLPLEPGDLTPPSAT